MNTSKKFPTVFISSTCYDLSQIREDIKVFIEENYGFEVLLSDFNSFPLDPCKGTYENCLENVDKRADLFILIVGNRYGSVTDSGKSITNLEYLHAKAKGIPIFAFVNKTIDNNLPIWRDNPNADFSKVTDNVKIFEFIASIYDDNLWVYNFEKFSDIGATLKNQFAFLFTDGLILRKALNNYSIINPNMQLSPELTRLQVEQPYAWQFKFFSLYLLEGYNDLQEKRWDYKYGVFKESVTSLELDDFLEMSKAKNNELLKLVQLLKTLLEETFRDATPSATEKNDIRMLAYVAKSILSVYEQIINTALYYKSLNVPSDLEKLVEAMYNLPKPFLQDFEDFIYNMKDQIFLIPDVDGGINRQMNFSCKLSEPDIAPVEKELKRIQDLLI